MQRNNDTSNAEAHVRFDNVGFFSLFLFCRADRAEIPEYKLSGGQTCRLVKLIMTGESLPQRKIEKYTSF